MPLDGFARRRKGKARKARRPTPTVRRMDFDYGPVPKYWFGGSAFGTHMSNGLHLLFPDGERFFVRSVRHYLDRLEDPELRASVQAFFGQEGSHAREHQRTFEILEGHGLDVDRFLRMYRRFAFDFLEPKFSPAVRLAVTAACEHFTATFAHGGLTTDEMDTAHPTMRALLMWHAAEEIEHKSVAFDVFEEVDGRYWVRAGGMVAAFLVLSGLWTAGTVSFLRQDPDVDLRRILGELQAARSKGRVGSFRMVGMFFDYLRPGFHPDQVDDYEIAREYLASVGRLAA
jgi:predicted metal-dependent hydrolase